MFQEKTIRTTAEFWQEVETTFQGSNWLFRGQADARWELQTSFERAFQVLDRSLWRAVEDYSLTAFKRRLHLFDDNVPSDSDVLEWLALMQHHGCPTRLLDWTRSPYVAAFFALDGDFDAAPAIWAIDTLVLQNDLYELDDELLEFASKGLRTGSPEVFGPHIVMGTKRGIYPVVPKRQNARLSAQQGVFLVEGDLSAGFAENLNTHFREGSLWKPSMFKLVIELSREERFNAMATLRRTNIHAASLFPGVDGYARSMRTDALLFGNQRQGPAQPWDDQF